MLLSVLYGQPAVTGRAPWTAAQETLNATVVRLAEAQLTNKSPWRFNGVGYRMVTHQGFLLVHGSRQYEIEGHPEMTFSDCVAAEAVERRESELGAQHACAAMSSGQVMATSIEFWAERSTVHSDNHGISCVGFTLNVALDALRDTPVLASKTLGQMVEFKRQWFIEGQRDRRGLVHALVTSDLGEAVALADGRPGDFAQFWRRNGSGHAVVVKEIIRRDGRIVGLKYISSQKSTHGIAEKTELFSDVAGEIERDKCHLARLGARPI